MCPLLSRWLACTCWSSPVSEMLINGHAVHLKHLIGTFLGRAVTSEEVSMIDDCSCCWWAMQTLICGASGWDVSLSLVFTVVELLFAWFWDTSDGLSISNLIGSDLISLLCWWGLRRNGWLLTLLLLEWIGICTKMLGSSTSVAELRGWWHFAFFIESSCWLRFWV